MGATSWSGKPLLEWGLPPRVGIPTPAEAPLTGRWPRDGGNSRGDGQGEQRKGLGAAELSSIPSTFPRET